MVGKAFLPSNAYYPRSLDYTFILGSMYVGLNNSDSSFVYGFMSLDYGLGTITTTTAFQRLNFVGIWNTIDTVEMVRPP